MQIVQENGNHIWAHLLLAQHHPYWKRISSQAQEGANAAISQERQVLKSNYEDSQIHIVLKTQH